MTCGHPLVVVGRVAGEISCPKSLRIPLPSLRYGRDNFNLDAEIWVEQRMRVLTGRASSGTYLARTTR